MRTHLHTILLGTLFLLAACFRAEPPEIGHIRTAQSGLRVSGRLVGEGGTIPEPLPASISGIRASIFLSRAKGAGEEGGEGTSGETIEDAELLQELIELLSADVQAMLNRSADRTEVLDDYAASLKNQIQRGELRLQALEEKEDDLRSAQKNLQRSAREIQENLDDALLAGEGERASALLKDFLREQTTLVQVEVDLRVTSRLAEAFEEILEPLADRRDAVNANRDALLKGVRVVDIPGVEELGIIEVEDGIARIRGRRGGFGR